MEHYFENVSDVTGDIEETTIKMKFTHGIFLKNLIDLLLAINNISRKETIYNSTLNLSFDGSGLNINETVVNSDNSESIKATFNIFLCKKEMEEYECSREVKVYIDVKELKGMCKSIDRLGPATIECDNSTLKLIIGTHGGTLDKNIIKTIPIIITSIIRDSFYSGIGKETNLPFILPSQELVKIKKDFDCNKHRPIYITIDSYQGIKIESSKEGAVSSTTIVYGEVDKNKLPTKLFSSHIAFLSKMNTVSSSLSFYESEHQSIKVKANIDKPSYLGTIDVTVGNG